MRHREAGTAPCRHEHTNDRVCCKNNFGIISAAAAAAANAVEEAVGDVLAALDAAGDAATTIAPAANTAALAVGTAPEPVAAMTEAARTRVWVIVDDAPATEGAAGGQSPAIAAAATAERAWAPDTEMSNV